MVACAFGLALLTLIVFDVVGITFSFGWQELGCFRLLQRLLDLLLYLSRCLLVVIRVRPNVDKLVHESFLLQVVCAHHFAFRLAVWSLV